MPDLPRGTRFAVSAPGPVTVGHADFPVWQVVRNGEVVPHAGPLITFDAPSSGTYTIERRRLPVETFGWIASALAAALLLALQWARFGFIERRWRNREDRSGAGNLPGHG